MEQNKYLKSFNWKEFIKITGSVFLMALGAVIGAFSEGALWRLIIGFGLIAIGIGLLFAE